jgi:hypothetical protein
MRPIPNLLEPAGTDPAGKNRRFKLAEEGEETPA